MYNITYEQKSQRQTSTIFVLLLVIGTLALASCQLPPPPELQAAITEGEKATEAADTSDEATEMTVPVDVLITNARLFDATGADVMENATIAISGNRIHSISTGKMDVEAETVINAQGKTVMPGLIDGHVHVFFDFVLTGGISYPKSQEELDAYIKTRMQEKFDDLLARGFTGIMSPGDFWPAIVNVRDRVAAAEIRGPRMFVSGGIFTAPGAHPAEGICSGSAFCAEHVAVQVDDEASARAWVRTYAESGVDLLKITYVEPDEEPSGPKLKPEVVAAIIDEAHQQGIRALAHAWDAADVNDLVKWGIDGFVHPFGITLDEDGSLLRSAGEKGLAVSSTFASTALFPGGSDPETAITLSNVQTAMRYGSPLVFGSDMPGFPIDLVRAAVVSAMSDLGLSNAEVLIASTRDTAQSLLAQDDLGTIEPGNLADIIIVNGDPLENLAALSQVEVVIANGQIVVDKR